MRYTGDTGAASAAWMLAASCGERRGDGLVGVEAQHPVVLRLVDRVLLLLAEAEPFLLHEARAVAPRDFRGAVAASGIDDHDLVGEGEALEAGREDRRGVASDQDGRERGSWRGVQRLSRRIGGPYSKQQ